MADKRIDVRSMLDGTNESPPRRTGPAPQRPPAQRMRSPGPDLEEVGNALDDAGVTDGMFERYEGGSQPAGREWVDNDGVIHDARSGGAEPGYAPSQADRERQRDAVAQANGEAPDLVQQAKSDAPPDTDEMALSLRSVQTHLKSLERLDEQFKELERMHPKDLVCDVSTPAGYKAALAGRSAWKQPRLEVERVRKMAKAPVLELERAIDGFAARWKKRLSEGEANYDEQIKVEDKRREEAKARERQQAEELRQQRLGKIRDMQQLVNRAVGKPVDDIDFKIGIVTRWNPTAEDFGEQAGHAAEVKASVLASLQEIREGAVAQEEQQQLLAKQRAELEEREQRQREADAERARQAEAERQEREAREAEARSAENARRERAEHREMLRQEITGIQQQAIIAMSGRLGVRAGGTLKCAQETLAETEAWTFDEGWWGHPDDADLRARRDEVLQQTLGAIRMVVVALEAQEKQTQEAKERAEALRKQEDAQQAEARAAQEKQEAEQREKARKQQEELERKQLIEQGWRDQVQRMMNLAVGAEPWSTSAELVKIRDSIMQITLNSNTVGGLVTEAKAQRANLLIRIDEMLKTARENEKRDRDAKEELERQEAAQNRERVEREVGATWAAPLAECLEHLGMAVSEVAAIAVGKPTIAKLKAGVDALGERAQEAAKILAEYREALDAAGSQSTPSQPQTD